MPLWKIYHPFEAFSDDDKRQISEQITEVYAAIMPKFYVGIVFEEVRSNSFYIGGKPVDNFVRISIDHIARSFPDLASSRRFIDRINAILKPFVADRGFNWEFHIDETPFDYWSINGFYPPKPSTPDERRWREENRPSPRTHD